MSMCVCNKGILNDEIAYIRQGSRSGDMDKGTQTRKMGQHKQTTHGRKVLKFKKFKPALLFFS